MAAKAFVMHYYKEVEFAARTLVRLRQVYPDDLVIVIADGLPSGQIADLTRQLQMIHVAGDRLKVWRKGGAWTHRYLSSFLELSEASVLLKIDPDTGVHWAIDTLPEADVFGSLRSWSNISYVQGGLIGMSRSLCQRLVDSSLLLDEQYCCANGWCYPRFKEGEGFLRPGEEAEPLPTPCQDAILMDALVRLKVPAFDWSGSRCESYFYGGEPAPLAAFTHPYYGGY